MHAEVCCHRAAHQNSRTDTDVPAAQVGAVGRAALVVPGEVHAHGLVSREDKPEACTDKECRDKEGHGRVAECEHEVSDDVQGHSGADEVYQVTPVDKPACHDAVENQSCGNERVEPAGAPDTEFLGIECDIVGDRPVGEPDKDEVHELRNSTGQEETVERKRRVRLLFLRGDFQCLHKDEADNAERNRNDEYDGIAEGLVQEHARHGTGGECEIHADAKIADAFATAACGQRVNRDRVACRGGNPEEKPVRKTDNGKDGDDTYRLVPDKAGRECKECPEVERLAAERVDQESGKGPAGECADGVERNDNACRCIVCLEFFDDVERKNRQQLVKTEE